ncbi:MAG: FAD-dependent oxidoreductase [Proteobacteria bacterium]|nr:FAD-dependent oxidoreductase [Pseudomonadota bacterium]
MQLLSLLAKNLALVWLAWPLAGQAQAPAGNAPVQREVIVYGGTPAGVMAAVAAARQGHTVALIDINNHVGGMISGGLVNTDIGDRKTVGGLAQEFLTRAVQYYAGKYGPDSPQLAACKNGRKFEPHVAELTFDRLLKEQPRITLWRRHRYHSVTFEGGRITALVVSDLADQSPCTFTGKVFIDASYEGDLMAGARVPYRVGREARQEYDEPLAGISVGPDEGKADKGVMAYNYRVSITGLPENRVLFPKPGNYDPEPWRKKFGPRIASGKIKTFADLFISKPGANGKHDANWCDLIGGSAGYPEADWTTRAQIEARHRDYFLSLLYYLQNDPELPGVLHDSAQQWGLPNDEFTDNGHFPFQLYVREARRMVGSYVLRESDLTQNRNKPDGVCAGSYGVDCHVVQILPLKGKSVIDRTPHISVEPYDIPYACLTPREPGNLLVPVCCSATHVAYCSLRMEPTYMMLGHAAGDAAHLAIAGQTTVQQVDVKALRALLRKEGAVLDTTLPATLKPSPPAPVDQFASDLKLLVDRKIVDAPDYWLANAVTGQQCDGERVAAMLLNMARHFEPATAATSSFQVLIAHKIFRSSTYWQERATTGHKCAGGNVRTVIRNFVQATE